MRLEKEKDSKIVDKIWDFFASIRLAIIIFALIALTSIIGTILEQRAAPERNIEILERLFGKSLAPGLYSLFEKLDFMDMYHSWWFITLLVIFSVNLVICSLERLPRIWRLAREPLNPVTDEQLRKFTLHKEIILKGKIEKARESVHEMMKKAGFRNYSEIKEEKGFQYLAQKGNYSRLGVYVTHLSILIILVGAILGMTFGFKGFLNLPEGATSDIAFSNAGREIPLGFFVRCDNFDIEFYGKSDMPKEYRSWLTIIEDGKEVLRKSIVVNDPLTYKGITFYQASYGLLSENLGRSIFILDIISGGGQAERLNLRLGDTFQIPATNISGKIIDFSPALRIDDHGHAFTYTNQMNNPAIYVEFFESGSRSFSGWILKRYPETWQLQGGHRVEFRDHWGVEYTGLHVRKDPGVWVVYLGCVLISVGLFIAFFISHRKMWVKIHEDKNNTRMIIGAVSNKGRAAFERKIDQAISAIQKKYERGK
ncbi:MAG: cytochrome c biogenesis protein ResB [Nitrospirota bacterium]